MSKIRNSLGVLVLPTTGGDSVSFDEYEKQNGINLHSLLVLDSDNEYLGLSPNISKLLVLDQSKAIEYFATDAVLKIAVVNVLGLNTTGHEGYTDYDLWLDTAVYRLCFRHTVYSDGTTPDGFIVFTQEL